jgi:hypothetical protein
VDLRRRRTRWGLALLAGAATAVLGAACGSAGDGASATASGGGSDALTAYRTCLRQQGIDVSTIPTAIPTARPSGSAFPRRSGTPQPRADRSAFPRPSGTAFPSGRPGFGGGFRPPGVDEQTWQKAQQACRSTLPSGGAFPRGGGAGRAGGSGGAYANCLADHGVSATASPSDADRAAAEKACAVLSPSPVA